MVTTCSTMKRLFPTLRKQYTSEWVSMTWDNELDVMGSYVWTDGTNIYYSYGYDQYVFNNGTWVEKDWNGGPSKVHGTYIWVDRKGRVHYSTGSNQYVLDGDTWVVAADNSADVVQYGDQVWTDGTNIYYSYLKNHYQYEEGEDFNTGTWTLITSDGLITEGTFRGAHVWTDGAEIYFSYDEAQYVLSGETWVAKTWNLTPFDGGNVWTDGTNIYLSEFGEQYILTDGAWEAMTWSGHEPYHGRYVWTDGKNIYDSEGDTSIQYYLALVPNQTSPFYYKQNGAWVEKEMSAIYQKTNGAWVEISKDDLPSGVNYVYREG